MGTNARVKPLVCMLQMPRYFFNVMNDVKSMDFEGRELPDLDAARVEALKDVEDILRSHFATVGNNWTKWSIEICNRDGDVLLVVPFSKN